MSANLYPYEHNLKNGIQIQNYFIIFQYFIYVWVSYVFSSLLHIQISPECIKILNLLISIQKKQLRGHCSKKSQKLVQKINQRNKKLWSNFYHYSSIRRQRICVCDKRNSDGDGDESGTGNAIGRGERERAIEKGHDSESGSIRS